jgi:hypothetical protein
MQKSAIIVLKMNAVFKCFVMWIHFYAFVIMLVFSLSYGTETPPPLMNFIYTFSMNILRNVKGE